MEAIKRTIGFLLLVCSLFPSITAEETSMAGGFETIDELFAAYKSAMNKQDWRAVYALGSPRYRMEELADFLILSVPRASEEQALRDVITRHGIPWMELRGEYERLVALDKDAAEVMKLISDRVDDKAGLFADLCGYGELQDMRTIQDLDRLTRKGTVARGWVGFSTPDGGVLRRKVLPDGTTVIINGEYTIDFHSIDGRWHLGVGDEGVEESENAGAEKTR